MAIFYSVTGICGNLVEQLPCAWFGLVAIAVRFDLIVSYDYGNIVQSSLLYGRIIVTASTQPQLKLRVTK
jgi:hypothetical protein